MKLDLRENSYNNIEELENRPSIKIISFRKCKLDYIEYTISENSKTNFRNLIDKM